MRYLALFQAASNQRQYRRDVLQPFTRLVVADDTEIFQIERQIVRQLAAVQLKTRFFILAHQVDHRLTAIARLGVNVLEQQQRRCASPLEDFTPFGLLIQQRGAQVLLRKRQQHGRILFHQGKRFVTVFPQQLIGILNQ